MKRISILSIGAVVAIAATTGFALADDPAGTPPSDPTAQAQTTLQNTANPQAETHAGDALAGIKERAAKVNQKASAKFDADASASVKATDEAGATDGAKVAERLGSEFGISTDALTAEKTDLNTSWGELMIAHTLMANSTTGVTAKDLMDLRAQGMGWGQIAVGMGLRLGDVISAVKAEGRVAKGLDKADGKVATIHGVGAKSGMGATKANTHASAKIGVKADAAAGGATEHAKVGVGAGVGAGAAGKLGK